MRYTTGGIGFSISVENKAAAEIPFAHAGFRICESGHNRHYATSLSPPAWRPAWAGGEAGVGARGAGHLPAALPHIV